MSARDAIRFTVASVDFFERPVVLRMPFRFGVVTMTEAPQLFTTVRMVDGHLSISSLACNGFASVVHPDGR